MNFKNEILLNKNGCKSASGITLIALVITIIVLLILAGVTIAMLTGSDSAPAKANEAKQKNDIGSAKDEVSMFVQNELTDAYEDVYVNGAAGGASVRIGNAVITAVNGKYGTALPHRNAHIQSKTNSTTGNGEVTIWTTDFKVLGTIDKNGGILSWGEIGANNGTISETPTSTKKMNEITFDNVQLEVGDTHTITVPANTENIISCSCTNSAISVTNEGVITANAATEGAIVTVTGVSGEYTTVTVIVNSAQESLAIGDPIDYTVTLDDNVVLNNWKVFYIDDDYTYIIMGDLLPSTIVCSYTTYLSSYSNPYGVYEYNRDTLISELTDSSNWSFLLNGKLNGTSMSNYSSLSNNMWAAGAPSIELWVNSWNSKYPNNRLYANYSEDVNNEGFDGWYLGFSNETNTDWVLFTGLEGVSDTLYFLPVQDYWGGAYAYWLSSPAAYGSNYGLGLQDDRIFAPDLNDVYGDCGCRPIICIPSSIFNE